MLTPAQVKTAVIIGKYGGCLPACTGGAIITGSFNLAGCVTIIEPPQEIDIEGGTIPMLPGEIQELYQPVPDQPGWWTRRDDPRKPKQLVKVEIKIKGKEYEKYLMVGKKSKRMMVKVANVILATEQRIKVAAKSIKHHKNRATVTVKNFVKKWWS